MPGCDEIDPSGFRAPTILPDCLSISNFTACSPLGDATFVEGSVGRTVDLKIVLFQYIHVLYRARLKGGSQVV